MNKIDRLITQLETLKKQLEAELEKQSLFGSDEDYENGTVFFWKRNFGGSKKYTYVALKLRKNAWWVSNKYNPNAGWVTFDQLVESYLKYALQEGIDNIWRATEWEAVAEV